MKRHTSALVLALGLALGPAGCAGGGGGASTDTPGDLSGDWTLTSATDAAGTIPLVETHPVTLTLDAESAVDGQGGGTASCNGYGVSTTIGPGPVTPTGWTEMACEPPEVMEVERRYLAALAATTEARVDGSLVLTGPSIELVFDPTPPAAALPLVGTEWELVSLTDTTDPDAAVSSLDGVVTVTFHDSGRVDIIGTCNDSSGDYTLDGTHVVVPGVESNGMGCNADVTSRDRLLFGLLQDSYYELPTSFSAAQLVLTGPNGIAANFTAVP